MKESIGEKFVDQTKLKRGDTFPVGKRVPAFKVYASPLETIARVKFTKDVQAMLAIAAKYGVGGLVMGLPINMDGTEGPRAQSTRAFVRNLLPLTTMPVTFCDERMSTMAVTRTLLEADASRARRAELVDKMAAAYILQGALDRMRTNMTDEPYGPSVMEE